MRILVSLFLLIAVFAIPAAAQDGCSIDVTETVTILLRAQRAADTGDTAGASAALAEAEAALAALAEGCGSEPAPDDNRNTTDVPMGEVFRGEDGAFVTLIPEGWEAEQQGMGSGAETVIGASFAPVENPPVLPNDIDPISFVVGSPYGLLRWLGIADTEGASAEEFLQAEDAIGLFAERIRNGDEGIPLTNLVTEPFVFNDRPALRVSFSVKLTETAPVLEAIMYLIEYTQGEQYAIASVVALEGESAAWLPYMEAVAAAAQVR